MMPAGKIDIDKFRSDIYTLMNSVIKDNPSKASNVTDRVLAILAFNMKPEDTEKPRKYRLTGIEWDVDGEGDASGLPTEAVLEIEGSGLENLTEDELEEYGFADWLSDKYGFCVSSFGWENA